MTSTLPFDRASVDATVSDLAMTLASVPAGARVAIVHDYLTQRGGAERVVLSLLRAFPGARLITSVYNPETTFPEFAAFDIETTWLDRVPVFRSDPRRAMPLLPFVFRGVKLVDVDVVICSSSGWAHGVSTRAPKIVYCHNPARWLYQRHEYVAEHGTAVRAVVKVMSPYLKWWDRRAAAGVDTYFANSRAVAGRIEREYDRVAEVLPPAITIDPLADREPVPGLEPGFLLTIGRSRAYKNTDVVCQAIATMPEERLVVVGGLPEPAGDGPAWPPHLVGVVDVSDAQLRWLYAHCAATVAASHEDFGLTPLEGNTFGRPAVVLEAGGFLDTLVQGQSGVYFPDLEPSSVVEAVRELRQLDIDSEVIVAHAESFGFDSFRARLVDEAQSLVVGRALHLASVPPRGLTYLGPLSAVAPLATGGLAAGALAAALVAPAPQNVLLALAAGCLSVVAAVLVRVDSVRRARRSLPAPSSAPQGASTEAPRRVLDVQS